MQSNMPGVTDLMAPVINREHRLERARALR